MEIYPLGHSSFRIKGKQATVVTDPFDSQKVGLKFPKTETPDVITISHEHLDHNCIAALGLSGGVGDTSGAFVVRGPGEYEIKGITIFGTATFHDGSSGSERGENVVYNMVVDGVRVCHLGDLGHKLTDEQVSKIDDVDVLLIPVGGVYTIDAKVAAEVVAQLEPRIVIPMHYRRSDDETKTVGKLEPLANFLREMGCEGLAPQAKLVTSADKLPESTTVIVLE